MVKKDRDSEGYLCHQGTAKGREARDSLARKRSAPIRNRKRSRFRLDCRCSAISSSYICHVCTYARVEEYLLSPRTHVPRPAVSGTRNSVRFGVSLLDAYRFARVQPLIAQNTSEEARLTFDTSSIHLIYFARATFALWRRKYRRGFAETNRTITRSASSRLRGLKCATI